MPIEHEKKLSIDFETYCELDVRKVGAFAYAQHESCEVLIFGYRYNRGPVKHWYPYRDRNPPKDLVRYMQDESVLLIAHNAQFERAIWAYTLGRTHGFSPIKATRWRCTAAMCAAAGLPRSLEMAGMALRLGIQKDKEGSKLIQIFCKPRKPTKANPATRIYPEDRPEEFARFVQYNATDILAEDEIEEVVPDLSPYEWGVFRHTELMNTRGLPLDTTSVRRGYRILQGLERDVINEVTTLTDGIRPTQRDRILEYLNTFGLDLENIQAKTIKDLVTAKGDGLAPNVLRLLQLRIEGGKASTKKLKKMLEVACIDGRVRGAFMFYGAHTGRLAGRLIQPQNFTRGEYKPHEQEALFGIINSPGGAAAMRAIFEWPIDAMAQGMRGYIRAPRGKKFVVCDFAAIEARVLAWLARELETIKLFVAGADLYKRLAVKLYRLKSEDEVTTPQRKFAKDLFLGSGYQLGWAGFIRNCLQRGIVISEADAKAGITTYRDDNPLIVRLWADVERCAVEAVERGAQPTKPVQLRNLRFYVDSMWFCIELPSGRVLRYPYPKVERTERYGRPVKKLTYRTEYKGKFIREGTYGGKLVENIVQAIARDLMVNSCFEAERRGYSVIGTVHDELITEVDEGFGSKHELEEILRIKPRWATDAPINAEGWESTRYRK